MKRPTAVTVFGILNLVFAGFGLLGLLSSLALFNGTAGSSANPVLQLMHDKPAFALWMKISIVIGVPVSGLLLAAGIGLLQLQSWARKLSIAYGIYAIIMVPLSTAVNFFYLILPLMHQAQQKQGPEAAAAVGGAIRGTIGGCFGLIYPILLIIFMLRPKIAAAFIPGPTTLTPPTQGQP